MKISLSWLKELVDYKLTPKDLADKLSLTSIGVKELTENFMELDLTYNRSDLLSLRGVAREIAAITGCKLLFTPPDKKDYPWGNLPKTPVEIENEKLSSVQCIAKIEGLNVKPSKPEWVKKLESSGVRSVNNLVDVTNLAMLEFGQPFHAFDADTVKDETIIVRVARADEEIATLDNKLRKLTNQDIVLADTKGAVDVGGIMGGKDTEVKQSTKTILLSASTFNPVMVRKTSKKLGLYSEASKRFQHGLTKTNLLAALAAAIKMYESLGGKLTAINLVGDFEDSPKSIKLSKKKVVELLGLEISADFIVSSLQKLQFKVKSTGEDQWEVTPPYFRLDIALEEDLIEEVLRIYGYDEIEGQPLTDETAQKLDQSFYNFIYDLKKACQKVGLTEVQTYSFYSTQVIAALGWDDVKQKYLVKIANPISSETEYLRQSIWPNLLEVVAKNLRKGCKDIAIFELGKAYFPDKNNNPKEEYRLAIALCNGTDNPAEELISIFKELGMEEELKETQPPPVATHLFHPNRFLAVTSQGVNSAHLQGVQIGGLGEVHLRVLNNLGIEKRVAVLEIELAQSLSKSKPILFTK